ncbi:serine hydrolase domain-containing protein [Kordiimonas sp.]|uniref:serine hydrolase domain-containing protein n=1 Tax=Kordiimonas sp. TaxID=1970157 RepID=UPI003A8F8EDC
MKKYLGILLAAIVGGMVWAGVVAVGATEGWWRSPIAADEDIKGFWAAGVGAISERSNGNAAFVLIKQNQIYDEHYSSVGRAVDRDTLFQVASLSKWVSAWGVLSLVDAGLLDLDAPVSRYLTRWHLPPSDYDNSGVTVRRLLSHTAGLTDDLGYGGFLPGGEVQSLEESLTKASDASPGKTGVVKVGMQPGVAYRYSGGGYTLLQLIVEEVSRMSFNDYMRDHVFKPLGMTRSTYITDGLPASDIAEIYDQDGSYATHYKFTSLAATSLYTSAQDMVTFINAHFPLNDRSAGRGVLTPETVALMRQPHASQAGADIWGLGTVLYAPNNKGDFIVGHDGKNEPAINTTARFDPASGDGIVILETGNALLATELAGEWTFWRTGNVDLFDFLAGMGQMIKAILLGWLVITAMAVFWSYRVYRARRS